MSSKVTKRRNWRKNQDAYCIVSASFSWRQTRPVSSECLAVSIASLPFPLIHSASDPAVDRAWRHHRKLRHRATSSAGRRHRHYFRRRLRPTSPCPRQYCDCLSSFYSLSIDRSSDLLIGVRCASNRSAPISFEANWANEWDLSLSAGVVQLYVRCKWLFATARQQAALVVFIATINHCPRCNARRTPAPKLQRMLKVQYGTRRKSQHTEMEMNPGWSGRRECVFCFPLPVEFPQGSNISPYF